MEGKKWEKSEEEEGNRMEESYSYRRGYHNLVLIMV